MTYRHSFLLTAENLLDLDSSCISDIYKKDQLQAVMTDLNPTINGAINGNNETRGGDMEEDITSLYFMKRETERLNDVLREEREKIDIQLELKDITSEFKEISQSSPLHSFKARKTLKEDHKIMSFDWSPDQRHVVCGTNEGSAYVWDGFTGQKEIAIQTPCRYVLSCSYSPSATLIGCCGFNGQCSLYSIDKKKSIVSTPKKDVGHHNEYMSNCAFFGSDQQILTTGGDGIVAQWDIHVDDPIQTYHGHNGVVTGLSVNKLNPFSLFATCGDDGKVFIWDVRSRNGDCILRLDRIGCEVNQVRFFPTGNSVGYTTADGKTYLYDLKAQKVLQTFYKPTILFGGSSLDFSKSGRILFVGYNDTTVRAWDTLKGEAVSIWYDHEDRISNVLMSNDGMALATSSWDGLLKIWA